MGKPRSKRKEEEEKTRLKFLSEQKLGVRVNFWFTSGSIKWAVDALIIMFLKLSDICYYDNINLINWFPDRDVTIVIVVIFQTNTHITSYWLAQLMLYIYQSVIFFIELQVN